MTSWDSPRGGKINSDLGQVRLCLFFQRGRKPTVEALSQHVSPQDTDLQKPRVCGRIPLRLSINGHPWEGLHAHPATRLPYSEGNFIDDLILSFMPSYLCKPVTSLLLSSSHLNTIFLFHQENKSNQKTIFSSFHTSPRGSSFSPHSQQRSPPPCPSSLTFSSLSLWQLPPFPSCIISFHSLLDFYLFIIFFLK